MTTALGPGKRAESCPHWHLASIVNSPSSAHHNAVRRVRNGVAVVSLPGRILRLDWHADMALMKPSAARPRRPRPEHVRAARDRDPLMSPAADNRKIGRARQVRMRLTGDATEN